MVAVGGRVGVWSGATRPHLTDDRRRLGPPVGWVRAGSRAPEGEETPPSEIFPLHSPM